MYVCTYAPMKSNSIQKKLVKRETVSYGMERKIIDCEPSELVQAQKLKSKQRMKAHNCKWTNKIIKSL